MNSRHLKFWKLLENSTFKVATLTVYLEVESASIKSIFQRKIEAKFDDLVKSPKMVILRIITY